MTGGDSGDDESFLLFSYNTNSLQIAHRTNYVKPLFSLGPATTRTGKSPSINYYMYPATLSTVSFSSKLIDDKAYVIPAGNSSQNAYIMNTGSPTAENFSSSSFHTSYFWGGSVYPMIVDSYTKNLLTVIKGIGDISIMFPISNLAGAVNSPTEIYTGSLNGAVGNRTGMYNNETITTNSPPPAWLTLDYQDGVLVSGRLQVNYVFYFTENSTSTPSDYTLYIGSLTVYETNRWKIQTV